MGSIGEFQGAENGAVFNLLSTGLTNSDAIDIYAKIGETEQFFYYAPENTSNPRLIPNCALNSSIANCPELFNFYVNYTFGTPDPCLGLSDDGDGVCDTDICLNDKYAYLLALKNLMDGNDKEGLLEKLQKAPNSAVTIQALLDASPYLSEEVLLALLGTTMTSGSKGLVLLDNAPLSVAVMTEAEGKVLSSDYTQLQQMKENNPVSDRGELARQIFVAEQAKNDVLFANINRLSLNNDQTSIFALLEEDDTPMATRLLITLKAKGGDIPGAQSLWTNLPENTQEEVEAKQIAELNILRFTNPSGEIKFNENQVAILYAIAEGQTPQAAYAMGLLSTFHEDVFVPELPESGVKSLNRRGTAGKETHISKNKTLKDIVVYPNPTNDVLYVKIPSMEEEVLVLLLYNVFGQEVKNISVKSGEQVKVNFHDLQPSIYLLNIQSKTNTLFSQKISVLK